MLITFNIPDAQVPRVREWALTLLPDTDAMGEPVTWTNQEIMEAFRQAIKDHIRGQVQQHELLKEHEAIFATYAPLDVADA